MSNIKLEELNLQNDNRLAVKKVKFNNVEFEVKQYLNISDKYILSQSVAYACLEEQGKIINTIKKDVITVLDIVAAYTNLEFVMPETLPEIYSLYDAIVTGKDENQNITLYELIISNIPNEELKELLKYIDKVLSYVINYNNNIGSLFSQIKDFINNLDGSALELITELYNKSMGNKIEGQITEEQEQEAREKVSHLTKKIKPLATVKKEEENNNSQDDSNDIKSSQENNNIDEIKQKEEEK